MESLSVISFLNKLELFCLHISIAIISTQLNSFNYCCVCSVASPRQAFLVNILRSQGAFPPGFYLPREGWVYCPTPEAPQKGNADGTEGIFGTCRMRVGYGPPPGPTIKRPCAILARSVGRATNTATQ